LAGNVAPLNILWGY